MIKLVIFDMDGTIFESYLNWKEIKKELGVESGRILSEIYHDKGVDVERLQVLEKYEAENSRKTKPLAGIEPFLAFLRSAGLRIALITNNNRENTSYLLKKYPMDFDLIITREMKMWKPEPDALIHAMNRFACQPDETVSIGDGHFDIISSKKAHITNIFIISDNSRAIDPALIDDSVTFFKDYLHLQEIINGRFHQLSIR